MNVTTTLSLQFLLLVLLGYIFGKAVGERSKEVSRSLTSFVLNLLIPALVIRGMTEGMSGGAGDTLNLLAVGVGYTLFVYILGYILYLLFGKTMRATLIRISAMFTNYSMFGFAVIEPLMGLSGLADYIVFVLPMRFLYYILPPILLSRAAGGKEAAGKQFFKFFLTPPVLCSFIGLFLGLTGTPLPGPVSGAVSSLSAACTPTGMILCGVLMSQFPLRSMFRLRYLFIPVLRNILVPGLLLLVVWILPLPSRYAMLPVVCAALPASSLMPSYASQYAGDEEVREVSAAMFISTAAAIATVPLWIKLASAVL